MRSVRQLLHVVGMVLTIMLAFFSVIATHLIALVVLHNQPILQKSLINYTRKTFIMGMTAAFAIFAPTRLRITTDASIPAKLFVKDAEVEGFVKAYLIDNLVLIGNHQIYTDWVFMWYLTYLSNTATSIHVVLKESILKIPILGWGMNNYRWVFMSRKWESDKTNMSNRLCEMDANARGYGPAQGVKAVYSQGDLVQWPPGVSANGTPYTLLLYPEGTNISPNTQPRLNAYMAKAGYPPLRHVLLPRVRGMYHTLRELRKTVTVVYDVTTGYSGIAAGEYAQLRYSLTDVAYDGTTPELVSLHIRAYRVDQIPISLEETVDEEADMKRFEEWLFKIWYEKEAMMDYYYKHGTFVADSASVTNDVTLRMKLRKPWDIWYVYAVPVTTAVLMRGVYLLGTRLARAFV